MDDRGKKQQKVAFWISSQVPSTTQPPFRFALIPAKKTPVEIIMRRIRVRGKLIWEITQERPDL